MASVDISNLLKARDLFEDFRKRLGNDHDKITAIHTFEFCFDLALVALREFMETQSILIRSNRHCLRQAAILGIISDPEQWFEFIRKKAIGESIYKKRSANEVIKVFDIFSISLTELVTNLSSRI